MVLIAFAAEMKLVLLTPTGLSSLTYKLTKQNQLRRITNL